MKGEESTSLLAVISRRIITGITDKVTLTPTKKEKYSQEAGNIIELSQYIPKTQLIFLHINTVSFCIIVGCAIWPGRSLPLPL